MENEIKLIHTADSHIGYRQYHSEVRRQDFLDAFSVVVSDAIDMQVDAVIHAGDLFDSRNPTLDDILDTMAILSRLKTAGIPFLAIVGNHESKQYTQWLDLYEKMGVATRLVTEPYRIGEVAVYGIDSVPKSKIPLFDYSVFNGKGTDAHYNILVMHQLMNPFSFGEWDCEEVIHSLPFEVNAILLGDYHKYEKTKVDETWVTYPGSTERNSTAEREVRSYNVVTIDSTGIDISRRNIPTRDFVFIPAVLSDNSKSYEEIFDAIKEHDIADKVVVVDISGDFEVSVSYSEIEDFLLSRKALVPKIRDIRIGGGINIDASIDVSFSDPDEVVKVEIKKMSLTNAGLLIDEIVRDPSIVKSKVDALAEERIAALIEGMDFTNPVPQNLPPVVDMERPPQMPEEFHKEEADSENIDSLSAEGSAKITVIEDVTEKNVTEKEVTEKEATGKDVTTKEKKPAPRQYNLGDYL
ncbi:MAG: exonuclease SbcCD subunit D [Methanosarcinaceae archaeon]|nr:exonuclease SbcCD subunit D [Methanosarcinaceae archaeon]